MVLAKVQAKFKEIDEKVKRWVAAQPPAIEVAVVTFASALQGGAIGGLMGTFTSDMAGQMPTPPTGPGGAALTPEAAATMRQMQALSGGPWVQARNFAVMTGVNAGATCAIKRIKGINTEDVSTSMAASFVSGMAFSLVSGVGSGPNPVVNVVSTGAAFALFQGALFQLGKMLGGGPKPTAAEAAEFERTKVMLTRLGLQRYEKNFRKGQLNDRTLPLLNESALQEIKIPPGPRLLILNHIKSIDGLEVQQPAAALAAPSASVVPSSTTSPSSSTGALST